MAAPTKAEIERKYGDILHAERPKNEAILRKYPRMSIADRAKIFAPFASLRGYSDRLMNEDGKLLRQKKVELSEYEEELLSSKLAQIKRGMRICVLYFVADQDDMGYYVKLEGNVIEFDPVFAQMKIEKTTINFDAIADIFGEEIEETAWRV